MILQALQIICSGFWSKLILIQIIYENSKNFGYFLIVKTNL